jgi:hypothetical protein
MQEVIINEIFRCLSGGTQVESKSVLTSACSATKPSIAIR